LETFPKPIYWLGVEKLNNTTKAHIHQPKEMYYNKKTGLVASYDIQSGGPILVLALHKFVPHLLT